METRDLTLRHITDRTGVPFDDFAKNLEAQLGQHDPSAYLECMTDPRQVEKVEAIMGFQALSGENFRYCSSRATS
jgi:hypothetical protein